MVRDVYDHQKPVLEEKKIYLKGAAKRSLTSGSSGLLCLIPLLASRTGFQDYHSLCDGLILDPTRFLLLCSTCWIVKWC